MASFDFGSMFSNPKFKRFAGESLQDLGYGLSTGTNFGNALGAATQRMGQMQPYRDQQYALEEQKAKDEEMRQRYAETLSSWGPEYADLAQGLVEGGLDPSETYWRAWERRYKPKDPMKPIEVNGQLVDPVTYEVLGDFRDPQPTGPDPEKLFGMEKDLAAQYGGQDPVKTYQAVRNGYERVRASATENSGAGDISMIFAYMKMLDPTSVVREGEFATAETAGGAGEQIANLYNRVLSGERLTPELRKEFLAAADKLYQESSQNLSALNEQYTTRAGAWGVDPTRFVVSPETYQPIGGAGPRTTSTGVNWSF